MPTLLPPPRRVQVKAKPSLASIVFNGFLVVSALLLAFVVLQREEEYGLGRPHPAVVRLNTDTLDMGLAGRAPL